MGSALADPQGRRGKGAGANGPQPRGSATVAGVREATRSPQRFRRSILGDSIYAGLRPRQGTEFKPEPRGKEGDNPAAEFPSTMKNHIRGGTGQKTIHHLRPGARLYVESG